LFLTIYESLNLITGSSGDDNDFFEGSVVADEYLV
jgi:hypothetical protein